MLKCIIGGLISEEMDILTLIITQDLVQSEAHVAYSTGTKLQMTLDTNQSSFVRFKFFGDSMKSKKLQLCAQKGQRALSESLSLSPWGADGRVK